MRIRLTFAVLFSLLAGCGGPPPVAPASPTETASDPAKAVGPAPVLAAAPVPAAAAPTTAPGATAPEVLSATPVALPGATGPAFLDYIAYERAASRIWVPVGSTGSVDVYDIAKGTFTRVDGFKTIEREANGKKRTLGPSAASVGDGVVYVGNRATSEVCPVDVKSLKVGKCLKLASPTDGVAYVAAAKEVWVTTGDHMLAILDASKPSALKAKTVIKVDGDPEGYAVDDAHGLFYTNLEDKNGTLVIDIATHKVKSTWKPGCGADGPRGIAVDGTRGFVFVACTDHVQILDGGHEGALLGKLETGEGVDNIDYLPSQQLLYIGAGKASRLTVARVDDRGELSVVATAVTAEGARNPVADANGGVYIAEGRGARLLAYPAPAHSH